MLEGSDIVIILMQRTHRRDVITAQCYFWHLHRFSVAVFVVVF